MSSPKAFLLWLTGLSGSGKSALGSQLYRTLQERKIHSWFLDADEIRQGLNKDLGFSPADRAENIRRVGELAKILVRAGVVTIAAFISPYRKDRRLVRSLFEPGRFIEVYLNCPLELCERRDPKGLYAKARSGLIPEFTGISAPYEAPERAELLLDTGRLSVPEATQAILQLLQQQKLLGS